MNAAIETIIVPRIRDLGGGFEVRRVLPSAERRTVGPFAFFDQMDPTTLLAGTGLDVRPHPHIGLATVTYLFDGEILHRDSLGTVQPIRPGAVNWMTAGRGIVHSERTPPEHRAGGARLFGIQTWAGLPKNDEEADPAFAHHPEDALPLLDGDGKRVRVIAGAFHGARSPLVLFSETLYVDAALAAGARLEIPPEYEDRAIYIAEGRIESTATASRKPDAGLSVRRPGHRDRRRTRSGPAARRCAARRAASPLVEFRLELDRADRAGESRLPRGPVPAGAGRDGVHCIPLPEDRSS